MPIRGERSYFSFATETVWGVSNETPTYIHLPVNSYTVDMQRNRRNARPALGMVQQFHGKSFNGMPSGQLVFPWYGWEPSGATQCVTQTLLDIAFSLLDEPPSFMGEWAVGPDVANVLHNGLRVNQVTISGDAASGQVLVTLDLMGKTETAVVTAQTLPNDRNKIVEAEFSDITCAIGGSALKIASFSLVQQNSLAAEYLNGTTPDYLTAGDRTMTLQVVPVQTADTYGAINRAFAESEVAAELVIKGRHNGTGASGTYWQQTISMARAAFIRPDENRGRELKKQPLNFEILKPQSSTASIVNTWALA